MWQEARVSLRPETAEDVNFLKDLVFSIRENLPGFREIPLAERTRILSEQAQLQSADYRRRFPHAHFVIVQSNDDPIGRFYVDHTPDHLRVIELSILPAFQGYGIGQRLMQSVLAEGQRTKLPVRLRVEIENPALRFYEKLGFRIDETEDSHHAMIWNPPA